MFLAGFVKIKGAMLIRYWIKFELPDVSSTNFGIGYGCGVTAHNWDDALNLLREKLFEEHPIPPINSVIEDIDVSTLDHGHVIPNMGVPVVRGVWFPNLNC